MKNAKLTTVVAHTEAEDRKGCLANELSLPDLKGHHCTPRYNVVETNAIASAGTGRLQS
jgi:hypothetical protein